MCSALGQQALVQEAIAAGAKDFLIKPFNAARVVEVIAKVTSQVPAA
jgi:two-component system chemotaxis response regulator CheY